MEFVDFADQENVAMRGYHGNAGRKQAYLHDATLWMVKFPQSTRGFQGKHLPSYTSSPLSEYIGSQIYASLGIPTHETVLGRCQGKLVVGCKDFTVRGELMDFHQIKNTVDEDFISGSYSSLSSGERLDDVISVIDNAAAFADMREAVRERFWDMFVVDGFIRNNDRNNGNWGLLVGRYTVELAPVFDNGNAFFNKRNASAATHRLSDDALAEQDVLTGVSFFTDGEDHHIHPFDYIASLQNPDCTAALIRFAKRLDMDRVKSIVNEIPEEVHGLSMITPDQKRHYVRLMEVAVEKHINPVLTELGQPTIA